MKRAATIVAISFLLGSSVAGAPIKTPPLQNGDPYVLPLEIHVGTHPPLLSGDPPGWAGAIVIPHVLDASELDVDAAALAPGFVGNALGSPNATFGPGPLASPFGPPSSNVQSSPLSLNFFLTPTATNSGLPSVMASSNIALGSLRLGVKGSSPAGNSDTDLTARLWNIWHVGTVTLVLEASDRLWMTAGQTAITTPFIISVPGGLANTTGHWVHNPSTLTIMAAPSVFLATFASTLALGIEHVPEPATGWLLGLGVACLGLHRTARWRRLRAE